MAVFNSGNFPDLEELTLDDHLAKLLTFLAKYQWIYDFQLTHYLCDRVWEKIPPEWIPSLCHLTVEELNNLPYGLIKDDWPTALYAFVQEAQRLSLSRIPSQKIMEPVKLTHNSERGMTPKKRHEVSQMTTLVHRICQESSCTNVVDVGAGLGYLSHTLKEQCGHNVLALECEQSRTHGAKARANKLDVSGVTSTTFELRNTPESFDKFSDLVSSIFLRRNTCATRACTDNQEHNNSDGFKHNTKQCVETNPSETMMPNFSCSPTICDTKSFSRRTETSSHKEAVDLQHNTECGSYDWCNSRERNCPSVPCENVTPHTDITAGVITMQNESDNNICMIGLHCCGSLTPAMLQLFVHEKTIRSLVCVSCCYHGMPVDSGGECVDFPMSEKIKKLQCQTREKFPGWKMSTFALRLAAQETRARWRKQTADEHEYHTKNVGYRALLEVFSQTEETFVKQKRRIAHKKDYSDLDSYLKAIFSRTSLTVDHYDKLKSLHEEQRDYFRFIEPLTALQVVLQPVLETIIHIDRLIFLREHGIQSTIVPIFDEAVSPRNLATVAMKQN